MDISQTFNILEVNSLKTNKLDYSYNNNIIEITLNNCTNINLNSSHSDYYLITKNNDMNINIELSSQVIGTKYRILFTNKQKSLKIKCTYVNDKFKGACKINNNSNTINKDTLINNLTKKQINHSDQYSDIIYIPNYKLGLYNGGYIDLVYLGNSNCNVPTELQVGCWLVSGNLIGEINIPKEIVANNLTNYILKIYILTSSVKKIICVTTTNIESGEIYFNNTENNNIMLFLDMFYKVQLIDVETSNLLYDSDTYDSENLNQIYNIVLCNNLVTNPENETYVSLKNVTENNNNNNTLEFIKGFTRDENNGETLNYNIRPIYENVILDYNKLNVIKFKIQNPDTIIEGFFNIIDIKMYNNKLSNTFELPNLLLGKHNMFTNKNNKIDSQTNESIY